MVWSHGKYNNRMNPSFIQLKLEQLFAKIRLLLNGLYFVGIVVSYGNFKAAVYTVWIFICICMSLRVFLFAKNTKFLTKGGIHCISQVFTWHFYLMREHSLFELTEHDDSAANIIVHSMYTYMYCCIHCTY